MSLSIPFSPQQRSGHSDIHPIYQHKNFVFLETVQQILAPSFVFLAGGAGVSKRINVFVSSSNSFFVDQSVLIAVQLLHSSLIPFAYVVCSQLYFHKKETVYNFTVSKLITIINSLFLLSLSFQYALSYSPYFLSHGKTVNKQS